ncbi:MAG: hypothetical protein ACK4PK_10870 [Alphaproteobacteria bacterium]
MTKDRQPPSWRVRLGAAVRDIVFPHLHAQGFVRTADAARDFSGFHRRRADGGYDLVEIQFDKNARPFFFVNLGIAPPEGVTLPDQKQIEPADVRIYHLAVQARFKGVFALSLAGRWLWPDKVCGDLARRAVLRFEDAEKWFSAPARPPASINVHDYSDIAAQMQRRGIKPS